jgi:ABC-type dipeptide/oligopeptide/nickel transport system ATPase component
MKVIGISGKKGSGKTSLAEAISSVAKEYGMDTKQIAFADPVKDGVKAIFGWSDTILEDRILKEQVDPFFGISPRQAMQRLGTGFGRDLVDENLWVAIAKVKCNFALENYTIPILTDVRYENEANLVRELGGFVIHIKTDDVSTDRHPSESTININPVMDKQFYNNKKDHLDLIRYARSLFEG